MHMLSSDTTVDMIYLDFSKAFDKVVHGVLLHKLKDLGITGKLGIWFFQFLTNRTHYVRIPGGISKDSPVLSGVPRGTVLGPLLFLIMISDINKGRHYISFSSSLSFNSYNVYAYPNMEIINPSDNVLDLGICMYSNCSFEFHIQNLCKKCSNLSGWILRTFTTRDSITMLTLFKSLVLPRLDYGSQLWSPHLVKHIDQLEKIQRSFT